MAEVWWQGRDGVSPSTIRRRREGWAIPLHHRVPGWSDPVALGGPCKLPYEPVRAGTCSSTRKNDQVPWLEERLLPVLGGMASAASVKPLDLFTGTTGVAQRSSSTTRDLHHLCRLGFPTRTFLAQACDRDKPQRYQQDACGVGSPPSTVSLGKPVTSRRRLRDSRYFQYPKNWGPR